MSDDVTSAPNQELNIPEALIVTPFTFRKGIAATKGVVEAGSSGLGSLIASFTVPFVAAYLEPEQIMALTGIIVAAWGFISKTGRNIFVNIGK